jgi:hypothetical protein
MLPKNHLKKNRSWWKISRTQQYLQKHGRKRKFSRKLTKKKTFQENVSETFRKNHSANKTISRKRNFRETKFCEKQANFRLFLLFGKRVFVSTQHIL